MEPRTACKSRVSAASGSPIVRKSISGCGPGGSSSRICASVCAAIAQSVWCMTITRSVPIAQEAASPRITSSVTRPPAVRSTCTTVNGSKNWNASSRASMQVTTAVGRAGLIDAPS